MRHFCPLTAASTAAGRIGGKPMMLAPFKHGLQRGPYKAELVCTSKNCRRELRQPTYKKEICGRGLIALHDRHAERCSGTMPLQGGWKPAQHHRFAHQPPSLRVSASSRIPQAPNRVCPMPVRWTLAALLLAVALVLPVRCAQIDEMIGSIVSRASAVCCHHSAAASCGPAASIPWLLDECKHP